MIKLLLSICIIISIIAAATASHTSLAELRQELADSIRDFQLNGEPEQFDDSLRHLISQLDRHQLSKPHTINLEWDSSPVISPLTHKQICFVVSSFEGMYINSGIGTAYYALAHQLANHGHSVTVVYTRDEPTVGGSWAEWTQYYEERGIHLVALPASDKQIATPKMQSTSLRVYRYLALNPQFDIVHFGDFEAHGFYSIMAKRISNQFVDTAFVVGLHGPTRWTLDSNTARIPTEETEIDLDWMERLSVENADAVWTPSAYIASWLSLKGWNLPKDNLHLLPLPAGPEFDPASTIAPTIVRPKEFVFFGRLETRKGLALFCDAVDLMAKVSKNLPEDLTITFLGSSGFVNGTEGEKYVQSRSAQWPFQVKIITNSNRKTALEYIQNSQRLPIIPSLADNAPYTVYECLYAGIPFLASDLSSITPLIADATDRATHLFQMKPHQIAAMMIKATRTGVSSVAPTFTVSKAENAWIAFYANVKPKDSIMTTADVPKVTVVITHYNRPALVEQAIASIEAQDYSNYEIVMVDDGSTDKEAIQFLVDSQAKFDSMKWKIIRGSNQYLGAARNTGARVARGKYLLFLDDDNTFVPTAISSYVRAAKLTGAKIVTAGHAVFSGASMPTQDSIMRYWVPLGASLASGLFKNTFGDANFFVEKDAFLAVGGFTEEKGVGLEEHEFFAKAVFAGQKLEVIPDMLLNYRYHSEEHQMLYTTDIRLGEVRRLRPYLSALTTRSTSSAESAQTQTVSEEEIHLAKKSLVHLVARNAVSPRTESCNGTLTAVSPNSGSVLGGTKITLTGAGFTCGTTSVTVDGNECTGVDIISNTELTCTTPSGNSVYSAVDIVLIISGDSITLRASYTYYPSPAPYLISAVLENNGEEVLCQFSSPTNRANLSKSALVCSKLLDEDTLALIGTANCAFVDDSYFSITLGSDATLRVGDNVTVFAGAVRGKGPGGIANVRTTIDVTVESNQTLITPTVSIKSAAAVASCEGISLDASASSGAGGRAFVAVVWQLTSSDNTSQSDIDAINTVLRNASTARNLTVNLNASIVPTGKYSFTLTLTNWLNISSSTIIQVTKSTSDVPTVSIAGNSLLKIYKTDAVALVGSSKGLACGSTSLAVTYSWTASPAVPALTDVSSPTLNIPAGTLTAATTYVFTLTVTTTDQVSNSANVTVVVTARALIAKLTGGTGQYATNATVNLDASGSSDPEDLAPLAFEWNCTTASRTPCSNITLTTSDIQSFPAASLGAGTYIFTVTVSGAANRTASASTTITITAIPFLSISISMTSTTVSVTEPVYLYGAVNQSNVAETDITWQWTLVSGNIESSNPYQSTTSKTLVINSDVLDTGSSYEYKLVGTHTPSGITGTATITFTTQKGGSVDTQTCAHSQTGGNTYQDTFLFDFGDSWALSSGVNKFQVFYNYPGSVTKIPAIPANTSVSSVSSRLPVGTFTAYATAKSSTGKTASTNCSVTIAIADIATIDADIQTASNFYDLTREVYSVYKSKTTESSAAFLTARPVILVAISRNLNTKGRTNLFNNDELTLVPAELALISNVQNGQLDLTETAGVGSLLFQTLMVSVASRSNADSTDTYLQAIGNIAAINTQLTQQIKNVQAGAQRSRSIAADDLSASISEFQSPDSTTADPYSGVTTVEGAQTAIATANKLITTNIINAIPTGVTKVILTDMADYSYHKDVPSTFDSTGVAMGVSATVVVPAGFVPSDTLKQGALTMKITESSTSPYSIPVGTTLASKAITVEGLDATNSDVSFGGQTVTVVIPDDSTTSTSGVNTCVMYNNSANNWTTDGVTTTSSSGSTTCTFPAISTFALLNSPSGLQFGGSVGVAPGTDSSDNNKSNAWIAGAVIGGVVGAAVLAVGAAFGVRKYRANQAGGAPAPAAGPSVLPARGSTAAAAGAFVDPPVEPIFAHTVEEPARPGTALPAFLHRSMGISPALPGFRPEAAAASGSGPHISDTSSQSSAGSADSSSSASSSSSRSRYQTRSNTSSDESMEAEIRNIVGELQSNLPRNANARELEDLGERLDVE
eukprot:TRINITY_DN3610_c0_g1_i1.p1 TRINITY_DN3610_c0_g1~~TRINITY_DN3610_c0_g1_i1.p1  ORF type:complete len:2035 (+),score=495.14 TRINITY_DN3610_c0_g1_i1:180-6284(+)